MKSFTSYKGENIAKLEHHNDETLYLKLDGDKDYRLLEANHKELLLVRKVLNNWHQSNENTKWRMTMWNRIKLFFGIGKNKKNYVIPDYPKLYTECLLDHNKIVECKEIIIKLWQPNKKRYAQITALTGLPAWLIFCIHYKESDCSFEGCLHNGDRIIGNGLLTHNDPKNRGPFNTWEEAAVDAIKMKENCFPTNWNYLPDCLLFAEKYNGLGHRLHDELSPYIWAYTNQSDESGNYTSDGHYNPDAVIKSAGIAALLITMINTFEIRISSDRFNTV